METAKVDIEKLTRVVHILITIIERLAIEANAPHLKKEAIDVLAYLCGVDGSLERGAGQTKIHKENGQDVREELTKRERIEVASQIRKTMRLDSGFSKNIER